MLRSIADFDHHVFLSQLADALIASAAGDDQLVHVNPSSGGCDVGFLPLEGRAPADALIGAVAPPEWSALGVVTGGRTVPLRHGRSSPVARSPVRVVVLVPREGEVVGRLRHQGRVHVEAPASGLVLDCLQRALGLPTAAPEAPATHLLAITWLERLLDAGRGRPLSWREMRALHPAFDFAPAGDDDGAELPALPEDVGRTMRWPRLRQLAVDGRWPETNLAPAEAAWFDDGSFARWIVSQRPTVTVLLAELRRVMGREAARRCARALRRSGIDVAA